MKSSTDTSSTEPARISSNSRFKQVVRLTALALWTVILVSLRVIAMPLAFVAPESERRIRQGCIRTWARGTLFLLGGRVHLSGLPPKAPYLQVSNHLSYLDIFALQSILGPVFVSKAEVASWPIFGWIARKMQTIFVDRERMRDLARVTGIVEDELKTGYGIHIFPEGGISQDVSVRPFKPGLFEVAVRMGIPVHYASVAYRTPQEAPPPSQWVTWTSGMSFLAHLKRLAAGPGFDILLTFGDAPLKADDRKQLAQELTEAVRAAYPGTE